MCGICVAHLRGKKRNTPCMNMVPTTPAFHVPAKVALALVNDGLAVLVNGGTAIQLLFSRLAHLRDASCKIDEAMLIAYAEGKKRARAAMLFWGNICGDEVIWSPEQMAESQQRIQSFV
jgi:hypothetical protein